MWFGDEKFRGSCVGSCGSAKQEIHASESLKEFRERKQGPDRERVEGVGAFQLVERQARKVVRTTSGWSAAEVVGDAQRWPILEMGVAVGN